MKSAAQERAERIETVAQLVHQYHHRAGTSATCGECSAVADSLAQVLLGAAPQTPGPAAGRTTHTNSEQEVDR